MLDNSVTLLFLAQVSQGVHVQETVRPSNAQELVSLKNFD